MQLTARDRRSLIVLGIVVVAAVLFFFLVVRKSGTPSSVGTLPSPRPGTGTPSTPAPSASPGTGSLLTITGRDPFRAPPGAVVGPPGGSSTSPSSSSPAPSTSVPVTYPTSTSPSSTSPSPTPSSSPATPTLAAPAPTSGPVGTTVKAAASGMKANATLTITATVGGTRATVTGGTKSAADGTATISFTVPPKPGTPSGGTPYPVAVKVSDGAHTVSATGTFTVTPSITLSATTTKVGANITISGTGFGAQGQALWAVYTPPSGTASIVLLSKKTDANGSFSGASFTIPASPSGSATMKIYDTLNNTASAALTIQASIGSLTPTSGPVDSTVSIPITGFKASTALTMVNVSVGGVTATVTGGTTTGANGSSTITFKVPAGLTSGRTYQVAIFISDGTNTLASSQSFKVT